jgi:hypothetical protein
MRLVRCINVPLYGGEGINRKTKFERFGTIEVFEDALKFAPVIFIGSLDSSCKEDNCGLNITVCARKEEKLSSSVMKRYGLLFRK